jgi:hypothetical protein
MSTGPKPPVKQASWGWENAIYTLFGAIGCYVGVWVGPSIHEWKPEWIPSMPDLYAAIGGMGIGFILASIANGMIAGMRGK